MHTGDVIFWLLLVGIPAFGALGMLGRHRARDSKGRTQAQGGIVSGWFAFRRARALENVKHYNGMLREAVRHRNKLTEQENARQAREAGRPDDTGGEPGTRRRRQPVQSTVIRVGEEQPPAEPTARSRRRRGNTETAPDDSGMADAPGPDGPDDPPKPRTPEPVAFDGESPQRRSTPRRTPEPPLAPSRSESPTLEGVVMTIQPDSAIGVPGVEPIIAGSAALRRNAMAGNAQAKRQGILGNAAAIDVLAGNLRKLAQAMSEIDQHYGPEITEPLTGAASHLTAASTILCELDGRLLAIITAARRLAESGVQAPHHDQMTVQR